eukprot:2926717-Prymnesium_polylepis.1
MYGGGALCDHPKVGSPDWIQNLRQNYLVNGQQISARMAWTIAAAGSMAHHNALPPAQQQH